MNTSSISRLPFRGVLPLFCKQKALGSQALRFRSSKTKATESENTPNYFERKEAKKQARIKNYQSRLDKIESLKSRRDGSPKDVLKSDFRGWWDARLAREEKWDRQARQQGKEWKIEVAVILERLPQVLPDKTGFENDYDELFAYLSQYGKDYPKEFSSTMGDKQAPISDEELLELLPEGFRPAPRETEADKTGVTNTLDRRLKESIFLVVDGKIPSSALKEGESLLDAAQRVVQENGGKKLDLYCPSAAPTAVSMALEKEDNGEYFGTKTFFMRVQHDEGDIQKEALKGSDFAWLDKVEIVAQMQSNGGDDEAKFYRYLL